uniref:Protein kinase domain-containing protein n=1 Tax=viral metagenome TaxID=1070528 RepID=A0A6C0EQT6_9ZZZZ
MVFLHISNDKSKDETKKQIGILKKMILTNSDVFMLIYMEGCGPCNATRPEWKKLENVFKKYKNHSTIGIVDIDKDLLPKLKIKEINPMGFPTIMYIKGKHFENFEDSDISVKERTVDSFGNWIEIKTGKQKGGNNFKQKGGIMIDVKDSDAFNHFLDNSTFSYLSKGAFGLTFKANLNPGVESKYKRIESSSTFDYGDEVRTIIIKLGFVHDAQMGQKENSVILNKLKLDFNTGELQTFKDEVNIQTELFLKTISYLQPICPAIVYSGVYSDVYSDVDTTNKNSLTGLLEKMYQASEDNITKVLIQNIYDSKIKRQFYNIGIIAMEFADSYTLLHSLVKETNFELYKNMTLYLLLKLAIDTGYTHGDFHPGNIFINTKSTNYFKGITGKPLLIDFGQAQKIPIDILKFMKEQYKIGNYTGALKRLCDINRPDGIIMTDHSSFYGFACGSYDYKNKLAITDFPPDTNSKINELISKRELAIDDMITLFKDKHDNFPEKYPLLPLSNAVKKSMYAGLIEGGKRKTKKNQKITKRKHKKHSKSYKKYK